MQPTKFHKLKNIREILLISLSCIGDVLLTTPVAKVLKDHFPNARLTILSGKTAWPLLREHDLVGRAIIFDNRGEHRGTKGMAKLIAMLRDTKYDLVVDLRNTAIPYTLRARHRITAHKAHLQNRDTRGRHAIDRHLDVLEAAGFPISSRAMCLNIPKSAMDGALRAMAEAGQAAEGILIGVYPGAGSAYKMYPAEKFKTVVAELAEKLPEARFAVVGGPADAGPGAVVASACPQRTADYCGKLDIAETAALISKCSLFISNDSGPMHIASALGVPTVAIFGPTDARRYGPRGPIHRIVWRREECNPCKAPTCGRESCINLVGEHDIVRAASDILEFKPRAPEYGGAPDGSASSQLNLFDDLNI